jgi:hypothetical protein
MENPGILKRFIIWTAGPIGALLILQLALYHSDPDSDLLLLLKYPIMLVEGNPEPEQNHLFSAFVLNTLLYAVPWAATTWTILSDGNGQRKYKASDIARATIVFGIIVFAALELLFHRARAISRDDFILLLIAMPVPGGPWIVSRMVINTVIYMSLFAWVYWGILKLRGRVAD